MGAVCVSIHILRHLKEEPAWVIDKWLQVISFKVSYTTKNKAIFKFKPILYALLCLCGPQLCILINAYEEVYPIFKQEPTKKAG